jgi:biotin carboxyl carrier protein
VQYEIEAGGRVRHVTVNRAGDGFAISLDGRPYQVSAARIDAQSLSLIVDTGVPARPQDPRDAGSDATGPAFIGGGLVYETTITPEIDERLVVLIGRMPVTVRLDRRGGGERQGGHATESGPLRLAAPMPGKVIRVLVKIGDAVRARQPVVVVEAMKMENELRADRDGTVAEIHAREGMSVDAGALLIVIQ